MLLKSKLISPLSHISSKPYILRDQLIYLPIPYTLIDSHHSFISNKLPTCYAIETHRFLSLRSLILFLAQSPRVVPLDSFDGV
jgi:hypothetical protein